MRLKPDFQLCRYLLRKVGQIGGFSLGPPRVRGGASVLGDSSWASGLFRDRRQLEALVTIIEIRAAQDGAQVASVLEIIGWAWAF